MSNYPYDPNGRIPYDPHAQNEPAGGRPFVPNRGPYEPSNSLTPPPPPEYSMHPGYTNYPPQPFQPSMPPPFRQPAPTPAGKPKGSVGKIVIIASIVGVLVIASVVGVLAVVIGRSGGGTVSATPVPYPALASSYIGTVRNTQVSVNGNVSFTSIVQTNGNVSGSITVGLPLLGSGLFSGTISSSGSVHLVDVSNDGSNVKITFTGSVNANKSMSGTYVVNNDQAGSWQAQPATAPMVYPALYPKYTGTYTNDSTGKAGNMSLTFTSQTQQMFSGNFILDAGSVGMTGSVGSDNHIQFTILITDATLAFSGIDNIDGSLSGTYIYTATAPSGGKNGHGTWKETPS